MGAACKLICVRPAYYCSPPTACRDLELLPYGHPSARHTQIRLAGHHRSTAGGESGGRRWREEYNIKRSAVELERFLDAPCLDVHLQEGEILHLPAYWFHSVLSLQPVGGESEGAGGGANLQCNSFMGAPSTTEAQETVERCMMQISGEL